MKNNTDNSPTKIRIDKWLWAARFFKTRQLAVKAVKNGKVSLNRQSCKPASTVKVEDELTVQRGYHEMKIEVLSLSDVRGSATVAQQLYSETEDSKKRREQVSEQMNSQPKIKFELRKPDKRGVREHRALKRQDS
jgi:ribosome-associated heat shock protein Hsp15